MTLRRLLPPIALSALSAMAFAVPAAQADANGPAVWKCTFTGTGSATPGTFSFWSNSLTCVIVDTGDGSLTDLPTVTPVTNGSISASSDDAIICGTGEVDGTATLSGGGYSATFGFSVKFIAGNGDIDISGGSGSGPNGDYDSVTGDGYAHIETTVPNCVTTFDVAGAFWMIAT